MSSDVLQDGEGLTFKDLPISDAVLRGIADYGFVRPSPIQAKAIPLARFGVPPAYVTAAWCGPTTLVLAREVGAPSNKIRRPGMYMCVGGC